MKCSHALCCAMKRPLVALLQFANPVQRGRRRPASFVNVSFSILHHERCRRACRARSSTAGQSCPLCQTEITSGNKILFKMGWRNPARCVFDPYTRSPPGNDARRKTKMASAKPHPRQMCAPIAQTHATATHSQPVSAPVPACPYPPPAA